MNRSISLSQFLCVCVVKRSMMKMAHNAFIYY
ncbi:mCG148096 [Mus musculus]|nr:mCG148096 [Mus musculus]